MQKTIRAFSEAAIGETTWQRALDVVVEDLGIAGATVVPLVGKLDVLPASTEFSEALAVYTRDGWHKQDIRFRGVPAMLKRGVGIDLDFISEAEMDHEPYYQDWLRPFGLRHFAGVHIKGFEEEWVLSLQRQSSAGHFGAEDLVRLGFLSDRIEEAANLFTVFGNMQVKAALEAFDQSKSAAIILNRTGDVIALTARAEEIIASGGIRLQSRRIQCLDRNSDLALASAIAKACSGDGLPSQTVRIARPRNVPLLAKVGQAAFGFKSLFSQSHAYILLSDPGRHQTPDVNTLKELLGLTTSEALVCSLLAQGKNPRETGVALNVSYETVRSHLRSVFQKTGLKNQVALVSFIISAAR